MDSGRYTAEIPHRRIVRPTGSKDRWDDMWDKWKACRRTDPSVWEEFEVLIRMPGFRFHHVNGGRFGEAVVALELHEAGFDCRRACSLFRTGLGKLRDVYEPVEAQLALAADRQPAVTNGSGARRRGGDQPRPHGPK